MAHVFMRSKKMRCSGHRWDLQFFFHLARGLNLQPEGHIWPIAFFFLIKTMLLFILDVLGRLAVQTFLCLQ